MGIPHTLIETNHNEKWNHIKKVNWKAETNFESFFHYQEYVNLTENRELGNETIPLNTFKRNLLFHSMTLGKSTELVK